MKAKMMPQFNFDHIHEPGHEGRDGSAIFAYGRLFALAVLGIGAGAFLLSWAYFIVLFVPNFLEWWAAL